MTRTTANGGAYLFDGLPDGEYRVDVVASTLPAGLARTFPATVPAAVQSEPRSVCPPDMALIDQRFCIDRWEAITRGQDGKDHSPYHAVTHEKVSAESRPGVVPQAYISMEEADQACTRAGKRLVFFADDGQRGLEPWTYVP